MLTDLLVNQRSIFFQTKLHRIFDRHLHFLFTLFHITGIKVFCEIRVSEDLLNCQSFIWVEQEGFLY